LGQEGKGVGAGRERGEIQAEAGVGPARGACDGSERDCSIEETTIRARPMIRAEAINRFLIDILQQVDRPVRQRRIFL
jgi:hypothetical protein